MRFSMRNVLTPLIVSLVFVSAVRAADTPRIFQSNGEDLAAAKAQVARPSEGLKDALDEIKESADKALELKIVTVMDKPTAPPSGDKHDYMSLSPYWWPDISKPDGKPYIRRDGEVNLDRAQYDLPKLEEMSDAAQPLALHYYFTGDDQYAKRSAEIMR